SSKRSVTGLSTSASSRGTSPATPPRNPKSWCRWCARTARCWASGMSTAPSRIVSTTTTGAEWKPCAGSSWITSTAGTEPGSPAGSRPALPVQRQGKLRAQAVIPGRQVAVRFQAPPPVGSIAKAVGQTDSLVQAARGVHAPLERTAERSPAPRRQVQLPLIAHAIAARVAAAVRGQVGVAVSLPRIHPGKVPARTQAQGIAQLAAPAPGHRTLRPGHPEPPGARVSQGIIAADAQGRQAQGALQPRGEDQIVVQGVARGCVD